MTLLASTLVSPCMITLAEPVVLLAVSRVAPTMFKAAFVMGSAVLRLESQGVHEITLEGGLERGVAYHHIEDGLFCGSLAPTMACACLEVSLKSCL